MIRYPRALWMFALALTLVTSLPYLIPALNTPSGYSYTGAAALPNGISVDYNSHLAKMWQGRRGDSGYRLLFTSEDHAALPLVQGFYVALGTITPFNLTVTYHMARAVLIFALVTTLWAFGARFFTDQAERWTFLLFATLVSGVSYLLLFIAPAQASNIAPIEFWLIDAYNLAGALFMPHFAAAICLQIIAVLAFLDHRPLVLTFALASLSIVQPYVIVLTIPLFGLLTLHAVIFKHTPLRQTFWLVIPFAAQTVLTLIQFAATQSDPIWRSFTAQNITLSPPPLYYVLGYLPFLIPVLAGVRKRHLRLNDLALPILWIVIVLILLYAPLPTQRRYLIGLQTPLAVVAALGWSALIQRLRSRRRTLVTGIYITFAALPIALLILANTTAQNPALYMSQDLVSAYEWLRRETNDEDAILTTFDISGAGSGGQLVAQTGQRVFIGHWIETTNFGAKIELVRRFYDTAEPASWRCEFLRDWNIVYIWHDAFARAQGDFNPANAPFLRREYANESVVIYQYLPEVCDGLLYNSTVEN